MDLSGPMLDRARADANDAGLGNAEFEQADVQVHPFEDDLFDVVISRFGIMFFNDPIAAFANVRRAMRPGGRLSFVCWRPMLDNEWLIVPGAALAEHVQVPDPGPSGAPGMFAFAEPHHVRAVLDSAGWRDVTITARDTTILVGGSGTLNDAVEFLRTGSIGRGMLNGVDPETEARALAAVRTALSPHVDTEGVCLGAAVWLVTAHS